MSCSHFLTTSIFFGGIRERFIYYDAMLSIACFCANPNFMLLIALSLMSAAQYDTDMDNPTAGNRIPGAPYPRIKIKSRIV